MRIRDRRRPSADERLDQELHDHQDRQIADYVARGMSEPEARRRVRLELGGLEQTKELCRDVRPGQWLSDLGRDIRLGVRRLAREPVFALSVILILSLGIGTSVTMFSVLNAVTLRPLPYARPQELARLSTHLIRQDQFDGTSGLNFLDWRAQSRTFASMTFYRRPSVSVVTFTGTDAPHRAQEGLVGPEFFEVLGANPIAGRTFTRDEFDRREPVVVLSEGLWQEQFGRSADAIGQTLPVGGEAHQVIGVMPSTFQLPTRDTRLWRPYSLVPEWPTPMSVRDSDAMEVLGRLAPGTSLEDATVELALIAGRLRDAHLVNRNIDIRVVSLFDHVVGNRVRRGVWLGFAAVVSLLAIACLNVAGLLSVRATRRRRELAVRAALGAGRLRLVRLLLAESTALWAVASGAGIVFGAGLIRLLHAYGPSMLPRMEQVSLDSRAMVFAFAGGLVVVLLSGTIPALAAAKADASAAFATRDQSALPRHRFQDVLVAGQIAGALLLLVCAALFAQSFIRAQREDPGYPAKHLLVVRIDLPRTSYPDTASVSAFFRDAQARIAHLPGVVGVAGVTDFFIRRNAGQWVTIEGLSGAQPDARLAIEGVTPGYFAAVGMELVAGRDFDDRDYEPGAPGVFIVSESLARRFWPGETALGKRLVSGTAPPADGRWRTVVGVVKDIRREGLDVAPILLAFNPSMPRLRDMIVHASPGIASLIPAVRRELRAIDRSLPVTEVFNVGDRLSERLGGRRFEAQVLTLFAAIAVLLSATGLYALLSYQVAVRTREIGIRSALGADRRAIVGMVVGRAVRLSLAGAAVGLGAAVATSRILQSLLYETAATDGPSYVAVATFVLLVAAIAACVPALRAARVSPMMALRE